VEVQMTLLVLDNFDGYLVYLLVLGGRSTVNGEEVFLDVGNHPAEEVILIHKHLLSRRIFQIMEQLEV